MSSEYIYRALLDSLVFLECAGGNILDPDTAIQQLESAADTLRNLAPEERIQLNEVARRMATEAENRGGDNPRIRALRSIVEELGLG